MLFATEGMDFISQASPRTYHNRSPFSSPGVEGNQAEVLKEGIDVLAVRHGTRRGWIIGLPEAVRAQSRHRPLPDDLPRCAIQSDHEKLVPFESGDENSIAPEHGRGMPRRKGRLPEDVTIRTKIDGQIHCTRNSGSVRPSKLRPIIG